MIKKSPSNGTTPNSLGPLSKTEPTESKGMTREERMRELLADPMCDVLPPSGKAFVFVGSPPLKPSKKP
jgi:hypothetical protein